MSIRLDNTDEMLGELMSSPATHAPTMGGLAKVRYTHADMIDFIIANPSVSQNSLAARYGYTAGWISNVMASDAWQSAMAARRDEIVDPALKATLEERFRGVTIQSLKRLMEKLEAPQVSDQVVLRAVELGAKAMGVGGNAPPAAPPARSRAPACPPAARAGGAPVTYGLPLLLRQAVQAG